MPKKGKGTKRRQRKSRQLIVYQQPQQPMVYQQQQPQPIVIQQQPQSFKGMVKQGFGNGLGFVGAELVGDAAVDVFADDNNYGGKRQNRQKTKKRKFRKSRS